MTSSKMDWGDSSIIESEELDRFFYESAKGEDENVIFHSYSVNVLESGFNLSGLEEYL
ncbi:hypothetical protein [Halorubrum sp. Atlit-26R]|uniref:hypothetical protein n=1 Tax=Halorubrum sp. Atlit-26R TaxID=2282128 RepID=UPI001314018A|nr:hypothetical protein [Halorubrum sp. Atlit-26R]